jgi:hypothetical protein
MADWLFRWVFTHQLPMATKIQLDVVRSVLGNGEGESLPQGGRGDDGFPSPSYSAVVHMVMTGPAHVMEHGLKLEG